ncbi:hypothetical protein [Floridanema aerugineum]|uniref:DUF3990 domain-containing protein n=1 Tax=Floridaenema aerugineum BLCC-F46 TaxID=3153654 RepID=A0ABV4X8Y1_9CYAN
MPENIRVYGYHGTSAEAAEGIIQQGFNVSSNDYDWLGTGVYFFQDAPVRAWEWANQQHPTNPAVIRSTIRLEDCIDLVDISWSSQIAAAYNLYLSKCQEANQPLPRQTAGAHRLDCAVINYAVSYFEEQSRKMVRAIRAVFLEGSPIFPGSYLYDRAHIQIAVRDRSLIEESCLIEI